eukprot:3011631-Amphidinium_carterae.2
MSTLTTISQPARRQSKESTTNSKRKGKSRKGQGQDRYADYTGGKKGSATPYGSTTPYSKGKGKGKYGSRPYNIKGKGKSPYYNTGSYRSYNNTYGRPSPGRYNKGKGRGKRKSKGTYDNSYPQQQEKGKGTKGKRKGMTGTVCYFCGRPGHTSDKCWWQGPTYNINQPASICSVFTTKRHSEQSTTTRNAPSSRNIICSYNNVATGCKQTGSSTKEFTDQRQVQQWAILTHTGAMTSVASPNQFPHVPLEQLRAEDPKTLTTVNGEQITMHAVKQLTMAYNNLAVPMTFTISDVNCAILGLDTIMRNGLCLKIDGLWIQRLSWKRPNGGETTQHCYSV